MEKNAKAHKRKNHEPKTLFCGTPVVHNVNQFTSGIVHHAVIDLIEPVSTDNREPPIPPEQTL